MKTILALAIIVTLAGCAGSTADTDFRTKVQEIDPTVTVSDNSNGTIDGTVGARIILRDPKGLKK